MYKSLLSLGVPVKHKISTSLLTFIILGTIFTTCSVCLCTSVHVLNISIQIGLYLNTTKYMRKTFWI